ncbi:SDR family NAD(P)-dependent oxidoreductase [Spelaeicoccus albus]|uniref:Ketoreductase domain-containing protein n=1 Tax=Spelaeicoccus albus TaxID=1280376 RepID=A0A7Z0A848_9MICO|nr:SDR family NAD(P)-dependent oxidoreductase [Spelaeicoccus albus]NYI66184.1 hypothetical protein [Spelaeicoccus albus]
MTRALITGGTSGIGLAFAKALASDGYDLVLVARTPTTLAEIKSELEREYGITAETLAADLSKRPDLDAVAERASRGDLDAIVNNAGYGLRGTFLDNDLAAWEAQDDVLTRAVMVLSHAAGRAMRDRGSGMIINVSSVAGYTTMGVYAAAKSWTTVFSEALATELAGTGVHVTAVLPGFVHSEFHRRAGLNMSWLPAAGWLTAEHVAGRGLSDARAGKTLSIPGAVYQVAARVARIAPRPLIRGISGGFASRRIKSN